MNAHTFWSKSHEDMMQSKLAYLKIGFWNPITFLPALPLMIEYVIIDTNNSYFVNLYCGYF